MHMLSNTEENYFNKNNYFIQIIKLILIAKTQTTLLK